MFVLFVAAVVAGPVSLALVLLAGSAAPVSATAKPPDVPAAITGSAAAGEAGLQAVTAWLGSTSRAELLPAGTGMRYPADADPVTSAHVAQVSPGPTSGQYVVVVATRSKASTGYVRVPVALGPNGAAPMALPVPVPAPVLGNPLRASYDVSDLSTSAPLTQTVAAVTNAYAKGEDLTRYCSPGAQIPSLEIGRFSGASLTKVMASQDAGPDKQLDTASPADGARATVLARFQLLDVDGKTGRPSALSLLMTARAGRWEVTAVDATPQTLSAATTTTTPPAPPATPASPTPSGSHQ